MGSKKGKSSVTRGASGTLTPPRKFDITKLPPAVKKSPLKLKDWLEVYIPWLIGPRIDSFEPSGGQRGTILTIHGARFATNRFDNEVTIGGQNAPVLAASTTELKVLVTKDVDTGPVKVTIGTRTAAGGYDFAVKGYPGGGDDGPPVFAMGAGDGAAGDVNPIGTIRVLVVVCQATDKVPANLANVRTGLNDRWTNVQTFYTQASFTRTNVQFDIVNTAAHLDGTFTDFVDLVTEVNVIGGQKNRIAAIAAQHAQDSGFNLNNYQMLCCVVFTNGAFIRAWGGVDTQNFSYDDGKAVADPAHIHIDITLSQKINLLWINESADWGRFAHEFGHNIVSAPTETGDGSATLGEDVYGSDLVDPGAATAQEFELMGDHDVHPIFTGYHLEKLGYYQAANMKELQWDRNPHSEDVDIIAHGLAEDANPNRFHILKIKISNALTYFVEVRQRPGMTAQIFDDSIPLGAAPNQGGVIVTRVIADEMHNNQQTRFITLMHANRVQIQGDVIEDPARALRITVLNDSVQARPLVCRVRVEWAQTIADDPNGSFDLNIEPWDGNWQSPDIRVDRDPIGTFDNALDAQGRPTGNGDKPWVNHINQFTARVHVSGAMGASNVKVTFYAITPPGVGDNGNWSPIAVKTIANIPQDGFRDTFCNWVPVVGNHTCLKVFASQQLGENSGGNNGAQENVFDFQAAGSSPADPLFIRTAVRNPLDEPRAIQLSMRGLPLGWAAQIPHAWIWLDGKSEKEIDVMVWPVADVNVYKVGTNKEGRFPGTAPFRVAGFIERNYSKTLEVSNTVPGSRFYPIGGTFYRVGVRKRATIRMEVTGKEQSKGAISVHGAVAPVRADQRILVDVLFPDGKTRRAAQTKTKSNGQFNVRINLLDDKKNLLTGPYRVQAFIFHASELADAESNVIYITR
jgi:IPT/TIG domain